MKKTTQPNPTNFNAKEKTMKKTISPKTTTAENLNHPPAPKPFPPTAHTLLARITERASEEESAVLYDLLRECAKSGLPLPIAALHVSSHAVGLHLFVEDLENYTEDFNGLARITLDDKGWLYRLLHRIFRMVNKGEDLTPEDVMQMVESELLQVENELESAREALRDNPKALAKEIRQAVEKYPDLIPRHATA